MNGIQRFKDARSLANNITAPSSSGGGPSNDNMIMRHASATLGSGNIRDAVKLPQGEDINEWIAVNS